MKAFLLLVWSVGAFASYIPNDWKIIGGSVADEGQFPYQISLRLSGKHLCGGSIIRPNTILTAGHCVNEKLVKNLAVLAGTNQINGKGKKYKVRLFTIHSNFDPVSLSYDIALVHLSSNIQYNRKIQPITLKTSFVGADVGCVLSGWGKTSYPGNVAQNLQFIDLLTIDNDSCSNMHNTSIADGEICTYTQVGEGSCEFDSGGPLALNGEQIGIVSWGKPCAIGIPDVFTRVSAFIEWIDSNLNN